MIVIFEASGPAIWKPGQFRSLLGGRKYRRVWWLWFSVSWWPGDVQEYGLAIRGAAWVRPVAAGAGAGATGN
jgi:hypothetical protein